jgi:hypothetical protein
VTIGACFNENSKGVASDSVTADCSTTVIAGARQMAINTMNVDLAMKVMRIVSYLILVASRTEGICCGGSACLLGMDLMTINAVYANRPVLARLPFSQGAGMTATTQICGGGNRHTFLGMLWSVGAMTGFAGDASQDKLAGGGIIPGGVTGETLARLLYLL